MKATRPNEKSNPLSICQGYTSREQRKRPKIRTWGALLDVMPRELSVALTQLQQSVAAKNFEQVVFAVLLSEEEQRLVSVEFFRADQSVDRAISL
jgi:hypothetical protein